MERLTADPTVQAAARIGATFAIDPITLLGEVDPVHRAIRVAAHNIVVADSNTKG